MYRFLKVSFFIIIFFIICNILSFFLRNDRNKYARLVMQDFYDQENIDFLLCGASHVAHGINPQLAKEYFSGNVFCSGTSAQKMPATYAVLKEAINKYKLKKVFVDLDFGMAIGQQIKFFDKKPSVDIYLVSTYLKNKLIKYEYLLKATTPKYYLNSILPIGVDKQIELNPITIVKNLKSKTTGEYYDYNYEAINASYVRGGVIMETESIKDGSFYASSKNITTITNNLNEDWKNAIKKIISICEENNIPLIFYSTPISDFFLNASGNYDIYISNVRQFLREYGYQFYDFSLCKEEYLTLSDYNFYDNNHLNKTGIEKFTPVFCKFFTGKIDQKDLFYDSYSEKIQNQKSCVYGLVIDKENENSIKIQPMVNSTNQEDICFDIFEINKKGENQIYKKTNNTTISYPKSTKKLKIISYYKTEKQTECIIELGTI